MKYKTAWIIAAIIGLGALAVVLALAFTHWNTDGKKERRTVPQYTLEELENADITATEATNADSNESAGTTLNNDQWEELAESLFRAIRFWSSHDNISKTEARLSRRKIVKMSMSFMTDRGGSSGRFRVQGHQRSMAGADEERSRSHSVNWGQVRIPSASTAW